LGWKGGKRRARSDTNQAGRAHYTLCMLDRFALPLLAAPHRAVARVFTRLGCTANGVTLTGAAVGLAAAPMIALGHFGAGLALFLANRFLDGVDGAMARATGPTDRGAFLDIVCDFFVYATIPLGFALANPTHNALPAATLLASFIGTASTFLAYAAVAAKHSSTSPSYPNKGIYYLGGLAEGTETILVFCAMCLAPQYFAMFAYAFAAACLVTTITRLIFGARSLD
jgi:phosphatidylglycerophosphate synthase